MLFWKWNANFLLVTWYAYIPVFPNNFYMLQKFDIPLLYIKNMTTLKTWAEMHLLAEAVASRRESAAVNE